MVRQLAGRLFMTQESGIYLNRVRKLMSGGIIGWLLDGSKLFVASKSEVGSCEL